MTAILADKFHWTVLDEPIGNRNATTFWYKLVKQFWFGVIEYARPPSSCFKYIVWQVCNRQIYVSACNGWEGPMWCHFRLICTTMHTSDLCIIFKFLCCSVIVWYTYVRTYVCVYVCVYLPYVCMCSYACLCVCTYIHCSILTCTQYGTYVCAHLSPAYSVSIYLLSPVHLPPASHLPPIFLPSHLPPICPLSHAIPSSRQHVPIFSKLPSCWCSAGAVSVRSTWNQRWVSTQAVQEALLAS